MPRFIIQENNARTFHFDYRWEKDGVFKLLAVPKELWLSFFARHQRLTQIAKSFTESSR